MDVDGYVGAIAVPTRRHTLECSLLGDEQESNDATSRQCGVVIAGECAVCSKPLSKLSPVVHKGEPLIHASCWTEEPEKRAKAKASPIKPAAQPVSPFSLRHGPCPRCTVPGQSPQEAAVEITRWTETGTETLDRCSRCGWEKVEPGLPQVAEERKPPSERDRKLAS
jgi:hypothetical protein